MRTPLWILDFTENSRSARFFDTWWKAYMENVRAYISLDDFFTFTKYPGLDPENCTQEYNCPGLDKGVYPNMRKMVLGISVTF